MKSSESAIKGSSAASGEPEARAVDAAKAALSEFSQQDDYLLAHGASLMSEDGHEIIHVDTLRRIASAILATATQGAPQEPLPAETAQPMFASHVGRRKWESLQGDGYRMQLIQFARNINGEERRGSIDPWGKVLWEDQGAPRVDLHDHTMRRDFEKRMLDFGWRDFSGRLDGEPRCWYYDNSNLNARWFGWRESARHAAAELVAAQGAPTPALLPGEAYRRPGLVCGQCGCADLLYEGAPTPAQDDPRALVEAIEDHLTGWKSATFGWQGDADPAIAEQNRRAAVQGHAAECIRRIRETLAAGIQPTPAQAEPFWHVVVSEKCPAINQAFRRADVAEEYALKCTANGYTGVEVIPLYRAGDAGKTVESAASSDLYISGPYPDGKYSICELGTGRVIQKLGLDEFPEPLRIAATHPKEPKHA